MMKGRTANQTAAHPGVLLREKIQELGLTVHGVAQDVGLPTTRLHEIIHERRGVTAETAIALGEYFGQPPSLWLEAQKSYELSRELAEKGEEIRARVRRRADAVAILSEEMIGEIQ